MGAFTAVAANSPCTHNATSQSMMKTSRRFVADKDNCRRAGIFRKAFKVLLITSMVSKTSSKSRGSFVIQSAMTHSKGTLGLAKVLLSD